MSDCENSRDEKLLKKSRRKIRLLFYAKSIGIVVCMSAVIALQTLQTSINIEGDKGAIALSAGYITSILFSLFCCPALLRLLGPNITLVLGDVCYLIYCLSNFFPELAVLTIGAIISGVGRSVFFPTYTIIMLEIATESASLSNSKTASHYQGYFQSRFYGMHESTAVIGNVVSYAVLYGFSSTTSDNPAGASGDFRTTSEPTVNTTNIFQDPYEFCGVNDCQDPEVIDNNIDQYVPPDKTSVLALISVASALTLCAVLVHSLVYPGIGPFGHKLRKIKEKSVAHVPKSNEDNESDEERKDSGRKNEAFAEEDKQLDYFTIHPSGEDPEFEDIKEEGGTDLTQDVSEEDVAISEDRKNNESLLSILKATGRFLIKPRAMMLSVSTLHFGMLLGFVVADMTRAYASCVAGVELTGLFAVVFGLTSIPTALLYGKLQFRGKRYIMYAVSCVLELLLLVWSFLWVPDPDEIWVVYVLFAGFGVVNGFFRQNIVAAYTLHFKEKNVAFSIFSVFFSTGLGLQYVLSTFMCVSAKIFTQAGVLTVGAILFVIAEYVRKLKIESESPQNKSSDQQVTEL